MQSVYTGHVTRAEWRWVFLISITLLLFSFVPFIILVIFNPPASDWQFMGALYDFQDAAANISRIRQGSDGYWLVQFWHTPEANQAALIHPLYTLLGHLSRLTVRSPVLIFHLGRMVAALFMYLSIYHLGASIWVRVNTRQIFFVITALGSGFGWLVALLTGLGSQWIVPDMVVPQAFPFYSASANIHFPLAIMGMALLASALIPVLRPGQAVEPGVDNQGLLVFLTSVMLSLVYPDVLLPLGFAYIGSVVVGAIKTRQSMICEWRWGLWVLVPALPIVAYDIATMMTNDFVASWIDQRGIGVPSVTMLFVGLGLPLIVGLPAIYRAVRRFEADGDRFMLLWLVAMVVTMYLPFLPLRHYAIAGIMLPIGYFATRSVHDFWFEYIRRRYRGRVYVVVVPLMLLSHVVWLFVPIIPILQDWSSVSGSVLEQGYTEAFDWLEMRIQPGDVILSSPDVGSWIPVWTGARPVYGHFSETYQAVIKKLAVREWYRMDNDAEACSLLIDQYRVRYVLVGPRERQIGAVACAENLTLVGSSARVMIYATPYTREDRGF